MRINWYSLWNAGIVMLGWSWAQPTIKVFVRRPRTSYENLLADSQTVNLSVGTAASTAKLLQKHETISREDSKCVVRQMATLCGLLNIVHWSCCYAVRTHNCLLVDNYTVNQFGTSSCKKHTRKVAIAKDKSKSKQSRRILNAQIRPKSCSANINILARESTIVRQN